MSGISTARKLGIFGRVAARQAGQSRWLRAGYSAAQITLRHFGRVLHLLWLEITGVFFLFFALAGGLACWREYLKWQARQDRSRQNDLRGLFCAGVFVVRSEFVLADATVG